MFLSVPLKSILVQLQVRDHVASVSSSLQYVNEEDRPLEAVFVFPLPADAAVCHFSARIGVQEIVAEVQDKQSVSLNSSCVVFYLFLLRPDPNQTHLCAEAKLWRTVALCPCYLE